MNTVRYHEIYAADGYYLSVRPPGERAVTTAYPARGENAQPSCPSCYRPGQAKGYCGRCEESGAAQRHRDGPRG